jgi:hypothetical protein
MKTAFVLALVALSASCHFDKLLSGSGGTPLSHHPPAGLAFGSGPGNAQAGQPLTPVLVSVVDSAGTRVAGADTLITVALGANPGTATLSGTVTTHAVNGVARFADLTIDKAGTGYTLTATVTGLRPDTSAAFDVTGPPPTTGNLTVTTATGGAGTDPDGYTVTVDGAGQPIAINDTHTFTGLVAGDHSIGLQGVASNCVVSAQNPRTVTVSAGSTAQTNFAVTCSAPANQPPVVIAGVDQQAAVGLVFTLSGASFSDPDHDGPWNVTIDWGDQTTPASFTAPSEGPISGSHPYGLLPATYTLTITVADSHGAAGKATKKVSVL